MKGDKINDRLKKYRQQKPKLSISNGTKIEPSSQNELVAQIIKMGYDVECVTLAMTKYKFKSVEEGLSYFHKDEETGKYHHRFLKVKNKEVCGICKSDVNLHKNYNVDNNVNQSNLTIEPLNNYNLSQSDIPLNPPKLLKPTINKISIDMLKQIESEFKDKNLCIICFAEELLLDNSYELTTCKHTFCHTCLRFYIAKQINENKVDKIFCLHPGCKVKIPDNEIRMFVDDSTFLKYRKFLFRMQFTAKRESGYIPCPFPNCEEWVQYRDKDYEFVSCNQGHEFCAKCKEEWHIDEPCTAINLIVNKCENIKICPGCKNFIEKDSDDTCNHMTCLFCDYEFCWLCLKQYNYYHFFVFNALGCPGLRYKTPTTTKVMKSHFLKCLWYFMSFFFGIIAMILIFVFFCFFGAAYDLVNCYLDDIPEEDDEDEDNIFNKEKALSPEEILQKKKENYLILGLLIFLGIALQPFYIFFKLLIALLECYKKYGCWFYYYSSY